MLRRVQICCNQARLQLLRTPSVRSWQRRSLLGRSGHSEILLTERGGGKVLRLAINFAGHPTSVCTVDAPAAGSNIAAFLICFDL